MWMPNKRSFYPVEFLEILSFPLPTLREDSGVKV